MNDTLHLFLLGSPHIRLGDQPLISFTTNKAQALIFYLAVTARTGAPHSREAIATLLWSEMADTQARQNLRTTLTELRHLLGDHLLIERQTIALQTARPFWIDVEALHQGLDPPPTAANLAARQAAVDLYMGEFLHGFSVHDAPLFEDWVLEQREQFHALVVKTLMGLVDEYGQTGNGAAALVANRRLLGLEPWSEPAHRQQMVLLAMRGERAAALAQYETCRRSLASEFGIEPLAETTALYEQIRQGELGKQGAKPYNLESPVQHAPPAVTGRDEQSDANPEAGDSGAPTRLVSYGLPLPVKLYGRQAELAQVQKWIAEDGCRLVGILGIGGQGKSALAATVARTFSVGFTHALWRSLLNAPPLAEVIQEWLYQLSSQTVTNLPASLDQQLSLLFDYLQRQRCLLILDNLESILQGKGRGGYYRPGYEGYGQLIRQVVEREHRSCLLLTSREAPQDLPGWTEDTPAVRSLALAGLPADAGRQLLQTRGLAGDQGGLAALVEQYSGNPLALKLAAETVQEIFFGDVAAFLQAETLLFDDIRAVLDQQFARLTPVERDLIIWLGVLREPTPFLLLRTLLAQPPPAHLVLEAIRSLQRRSLLESAETGFSLQNVVLEYANEWLIEHIVRELVDDNPDKMTGWQADKVISPTEHRVIRSSGHPVILSASHPLTASPLNRYALILAQAKEYVRLSQVRQLLQLVAERLVAHLGSIAATQRLHTLLAQLRQTAPRTPGYAAANLLHLLLHLGVDLDGYDFSRLAVWRAYLRGVALPHVNLAGADLSGAVFTEKLGRMHKVAFSPDGHLLAASTRDGAIHLWRTADQQLVQVIHAHNNPIFSLAFYQRPEAGGETRLWLASAGEDQTVGLWQVTGSVEQHWHGQLLHGHRQRAINVGFSADGQHLMSVDIEGDVLIWEVATGRLTQRFSSQPTLLHRVAFSHHGQILASVNSEGLVRLWQILRDGAQSGPDEHPATAPRLVLDGHTARVAAVAFSPDDQMLVSGDDDGLICLWSLPQGQRQRVWEAAHGGVHVLAVSPDGKTLASGHWDRTICLWAIDTGQLRHTLVGHSHMIKSIAFHPSGEILASGGSDQMVRLWDARSGQALNTLRGHHYALNAAALSPDGRWLAGVGYDQLLHLWSLQGGHTVVAQRAWRGHSSLIHTVAFSPDGRTLASAGRDPAIYLWDVASGQVRQTLYGHTQDIYRVAFHPAGELLASASADGTVRLWVWRSGRLVGTLTPDSGMVYTVAFSPDGRTLASAGVGQTIRFWDLTQPHHPELVAARLVMQEAEEREILSLAFSPDGARLAAGSTHRGYLWDVRSGELQAILRQHFDWVMSIAFSPDGATLASASEDRTICLWDVARGELRTVLRGHDEGVYGVVFSPDGAWWVSAGADGAIKFWAGTPQGGAECVNTLFIAGPYAGMNISGVTGITEAQKTALKTLGAVEDPLTPAL